MYGKMQESGPTEIPLICTLAIWGQCPGFLHPEFPQGSPVHHQWRLQSLKTETLFTGMAGNIPFLSIFP